MELKTLKKLLKLDPNYDTCPAYSNFEGQKKRIMSERSSPWG